MSIIAQIMTFLFEYINAEIISLNKHATTILVKSSTNKNTVINLQFMGEMLIPYQTRELKYKPENCLQVSLENELMPAFWAMSETEWKFFWTSVFGKA